jgi:hypothetical protein
MSTCDLSGFGSLRAESIPGDTRFTTALPLRAAQNLRASAEDRP